MCWRRIGCARIKMCTMVEVPNCFHDWGCLWLTQAYYDYDCGVYLVVFNLILICSGDFPDVTLVCAGDQCHSYEWSPASKGWPSQWGEGALSSTLFFFPPPSPPSSPIPFTYFLLPRFHLLSTASSLFHSLFLISLSIPHFNSPFPHSWSF